MTEYVQRHNRTSLVRSVLTGAEEPPRLDLLRKLYDFLPVDAAAFNMNSWQDPLMSGTTFTREDLHKCGNTACIAGYASLMPEWSQNGGTIDACTSAPTFHVDADLTLYGARAFAALFQLPLGLAAALTQPSLLIIRSPLGRISERTHLKFGNHKGSVADLVDPLAVDFNTSLTLFTILIIVAEGGWEKVGDPLPRAIRNISRSASYAGDIYDINFHSLYGLWSTWTPDHARRALHWIINKLGV